MKVIIAAVCDHAWVENGCLSLFRAFDNVNAAGFPFTLSRMSVALRILIPRSESGMHKKGIILFDSDGKKLMNSDIDINFQPPQGDIPEAAFSFALNGQNIVFAKPGGYSVEVLVDGKPEAGVPFYVRQSSSQGGMDIPDRI
jgi:hypothetical protein